MPLQALINGLETCSFLTSREKEIIQLAHEGLTNKEIASRLFISAGTVKKHFDNIFNKLQVGNKMQALNKIKGLIKYA